MDVEELTLGELASDERDTEEDAAERRTIVLIVSAPKELKPKRFRFRLDETVGEAAKAAAKSFDYQEGGTPSFQLENGDVLDRTLTLRAAGLHSLEKVELVDAGGGV
jgi:hypothetical protein